jgi:hypothetical protein
MKPTPHITLLEIYTTHHKPHCQETHELAYRSDPNPSTTPGGTIRREELLLGRWELHREGGTSYCGRREELLPGRRNYTVARSILEGGNPLLVKRNYY